MTFKREKKPILTIKKQNFSKSQLSHFSKGVDPSVGIFLKKKACVNLFAKKRLNFFTQKQDSFLSRTSINIISNIVLNAKKLRKNWNFTKSK